MFEARQEAKPKKIMEVLGWKIYVDERNYTTSKGNVNYYHMSLLNALLDIADMEQRDALKLKGYADLEKAINTVKTVNDHLVSELEDRLSKK